MPKTLQDQFCPYCAKLVDYHESSSGKMLCEVCGMSKEGARALVRAAPEPGASTPNPKPTPAPAAAPSSAPVSDDEQMKVAAVAAFLAASDGRHHEIDRKGKMALDVIVWHAKFQETGVVAHADDAVRSLEAAGYDLRRIVEPKALAEMRAALGLRPSLPPTPYGAVIVVGFLIWLVTRLLFGYTVATSVAVTLFVLLVVVPWVARNTRS